MVSFPPFWRLKQSWERCDFEFYKRTEVVRQAKTETISAFNAIQIGYRFELRYLKEHSKKEDLQPDEEGVVMLCRKNKTAECLKNIIPKT